MRNLKRALSLLLSSTMVLGMVAMGGSAAGYQDVDDTYNKEAIEVLQAVGIMTGDENGNFNPDKGVTRNEMAVIMSNLMAYNVATYAGTSPFTDVPDWAEPYVAACWTNGITAGTSATTYGGDDTVTTAQAALMIMKALGYFQYQSDFGSDWQLSTVSQGNKIDLFEKVNSGVKEAMSRNDVAQLVLNGLQSGTVVAENNGSITVGDTTIVSGVKYNYVTSTQDYAYTISKVSSTTDQTDAGASIVELGEKLYQGDLTLNSYEEPGSLYNDVFGRPANTWEYQAKEIGTYAQDADTSFSGTVTSKKLYDAVGSTATDYTWYVTVDGEKVAYTGNNLNANKTDDNDDFMKKAGIGDDGMYTGNGVRTQVYVDGTKKVVFVSVTHYYAAEVYEVKDGYITLSNVHSYDDYASKIADTNDEFETDAAFAEDDIVLYSFADNEIQEVYKATSMDGTVSRVRVDSKDKEGDYFDIGETRYNYNTTVDTTERLVTENVNNDMVGYLDQYGYVAYIDESAVSYDYAYVLSMGTDDDQFGNSTNGNANSTVYARLVLTDGSLVKAETDLKASKIADYNNHIVSYTVDKNNVYTLSIRDVDNDEGTPGTDSYDAGNIRGTDGAQDAQNGTLLKIESGVAAFTAQSSSANASRTGYTANSNTVFIVAEQGEDLDSYDYYVYTGVKNVPNIEGTFKDSDNDGIYDAPVGGVYTDTPAKVAVAADEKGVAKVVYIQDADVSGAGQVIFARADENAKLVRDTETGDFREISAVVNGEVVTLNVKVGSEAETKLTETVFDNGVGYSLGGDAGKVKRIVALESITTNADGLVTNVRLYDSLASDVDREDGWATYQSTDKTSKETVVLNGNAYAYYDDVAVVRYDTESGTFSASTVNSIKKDSNDYTLAVFASKVLNGLCVVEYPNDGTPVIPTPVDGAVTIDSALNKGTVTESSATVNSRGVGSFSFEFSAPEWVADNATATFTYDLYVNGELDTLGASASMNRTAAQTYSYRATLSGSFDVEDEITIKITGVTYGDVKVQYFNGTTDITDKMVADGSSATLATSGTNNLDIKYASSDGAKTIKATVTGATASGSAITEQTLSYSSSAYAQTVASSVADGNAYVKVSVTGLDTLVETYDITSETATLTDGTGNAVTNYGVAATDPENANTLKIAAKSPSNLTGNKLGDYVELEAEFGTAFQATTYGMKVTVTIGGQDYSAVVKAYDTAESLGFVKVTGDIEIKDADVKVETINVVDVAENADGTPVISHTVGTNVYTITFNTEIKSVNADGKVVAGTDVTTDGTGNSVVSAEISGNQLIVTLAKELDTTKKITIVANKFASAQDDNNKNTTKADLTVTIASGEETWAK